MELTADNRLHLRFLPYRDIQVETDQLIYINAEQTVAERIEAVFCGQATLNSDQIQWRGQNWNVDNCRVIRGAETFTENHLPAEYLRHKGLSEVEATDILDRYELHSCSHRRVKQLDPADQKKLELLAALADLSKPIILIDPFLTFNGRWREHFAELCLNWVASSGPAMIALRIGFEPSCWLESDRVNTITPIEPVTINRASKVNNKNHNSNNPNRQAGADHERFLSQLVSQEAAQALANNYAIKMFTERLKNLRGLSGLLAALLITSLVATTGVVTYNVTAGARDWQVIGGSEYNQLIDRQHVNDSAKTSFSKPGEIAVVSGDKESNQTIAEQHAERLPQYTSESISEFLDRQQPYCDRQLYCPEY